jgi:hypothetical protein
MAANGRLCCKKAPYGAATDAATNLCGARGGKEMSDDREANAARRAPNRTDLGQYYREIGISALAAALPYIGAQKNHAYAPAKQKVLTIRDLERLLG